MSKYYYEIPTYYELPHENKLLHLQGQLIDINFNTGVIKCKSPISPLILSALKWIENLLLSTV